MGRIFLTIITMFLLVIQALFFSLFRHSIDILPYVFELVQHLVENVYVESQYVAVHFGLVCVQSISSENDVSFAKHGPTDVKLTIFQ